MTQIWRIYLLTDSVPHVHVPCTRLTHEQLNSFLSASPLFDGKKIVGSICGIVSRCVILPLSPYPFLLFILDLRFLVIFLSKENTWLIGCPGWYDIPISVRTIAAPSRKVGIFLYDSWLFSLFLPPVFFLAVFLGCECAVRGVFAQCPWCLWGLIDIQGWAVQLRMMFGCVRDASLRCLWVVCLPGGTEQGLVVVGFLFLCGWLRSGGTSTIIWQINQPSILQFC